MRIYVRNEPMEKVEKYIYLGTAIYKEHINNCPEEIKSRIGIGRFMGMVTI